MDVEFIEPSRPKRAHWTLLLGLVALLVVVWACVAGATREIAHRRTLLAHAKAIAEQERERERAAARLPVRMPYEDDAWHAWRLGRFETLGALRALEVVSIEGVSLSSIDVEAEQGDVAIKFKAVGADAMDSYLRSLNAHDQGSPWTISKVMSENGSGMPGVPFTLVVTASSHWGGL